MECCRWLSYETMSQTVAATAASPAAASHHIATSSSAPSPISSKKSFYSNQRAKDGRAEPRRTHSKQPSSSKPPPPPPSPSSATPSSRVVYGPGTIVRLPTELGRMGLTSPMIVASPSRMATARHIQSLIPNLDSYILDSAVVNVRAQLVDDAVGRVTGRDCVISVGGASAVGLARAVSIRKAIPHICIPTTYSGSEVLRTSGSKHNSRQSAVSVASCNAKQRVKPAVIIYDEELTAAVPKRIFIPANNAGRQPRSDDAQSPSSKWSFMQLPGI